jgi:hypothetical protein
VLLAYSYHPEFAPAHQYLARDVRFDSYPKQWDLFVASDQDGQPVTIEWQLPQVTGGSCLGVEFSVNDVTGGTAVDLSQLNYSYTNNAAVTRQFQLSAAQVVEAPPPPPLNLFSPRTGTASALLAWSGGNDPAVVGSHVYRRDPGAVEFLRLTVVPTASAKYIDSGLAPGSYTYLVTAVTATGCESIPSNEITVFVSP